MVCARAASFCYSMACTLLCSQRFLWIYSECNPTLVVSSTLHSQVRKILVLALTEFAVTALFIKRIT